MRNAAKDPHDITDVMRNAAKDIRISVLIRRGGKGPRDITDVMRSAAKDPISVLLYGSEAWATTLADRGRLDLFDMRCQMRLLCVFWHQQTSNQSIRERTKQPSASSLLRQRRLWWFEHLHRMPSSLPVRRVFDFNPNIHGWKRP